MSHEPDNILAGKQVVSLVEVSGTNNSLVHPRGAVWFCKTSVPVRKHRAAKCLGPQWTLGRMNSVAQLSTIDSHSDNAPTTKRQIASSSKRGGKWLNE